MHFQNRLLATQGRAPSQLKEFCLIKEDDAPKGYIVNECAINEMERIAQAAHLKRDFKIIQPTFFSDDQNLLDQNLTALSSKFPALDILSSGVSLNATSSHSQGSSGVGSYPSFDSNISHTSLPDNYMSRYYFIFY